MATASAAETHFRAVAPKYMALLMQDFPMLDVLDAAAVFGNAGHESKGLTDDQEDKPVVAGSRGGANWMQWTGPRRKALEAYCARNGLDPNSDAAAYKWLFLELKGAEKKAIPALVAAKTLKTKVEAFEKAFLRAGVKHYPSRLHWAEIALDAFGDTSAAPTPAPADPIPAEPLPPPANPSRPSFWPIILIGLAAAAVFAWQWFSGQQAPASLLGGPPVPLDRPVKLFGGGSSIWTEIGLQLALPFLVPLISAAATAVIGWVGYWWARFFKVTFDQRSSDMLHAAIERAVIAAVTLLGSRAGKDNVLNKAAEYIEAYNPGSVKKFGLTRDSLIDLAAGHYDAAKRVAK